MPEPHFTLTSDGVAWSHAERNRRVARRVVPPALAVVVLSALNAARFDMYYEVFTQHFLLALAALYVAGVAGALAADVTRRPSRRQGRAGAITITADGLVVRRGEEERRFPRSAIEQGWMEEGRVVLRLTSGLEVAAVVPNEAQGEALLGAAGVAAQDRVLRVPLTSAASQSRVGETLGAMGLIWLAPMCVAALVVASLFWRETGRVSLEAAMCLFAALAAALGARRLYRYLAPREAVIGIDGIAVHGHPRRFVPYTAVEGVERDGHGVRLRLRGGESALLPVRAHAYAPLPSAAAPAPDSESLPRRERAKAAHDAENLARREVLFRRIERAMSSIGVSAEASAALDRLARRGRDVTEWRDDLRRLLDGQGDYRAMRIAPDVLHEVLADAGAAPDRRIAAAVALSGSSDAADRARVRIAVDACADEDLRAALERAAEGEIDEDAIHRISIRVRGA